MRRDAANVEEHYLRESAEQTVVFRIERGPDRQLEQSAWDALDEEPRSGTACMLEKKKECATGSMVHSV